MPYLTDYKRFVIENPHDGLIPKGRTLSGNPWRSGNKKRASVASPRCLGTLPPNGGVIARAPL